MCYKLDQTAKSDCVFLDNKIGLPVKCKNAECPGTKELKCFISDTLNISFDC